MAKLQVEVGILDKISSQVAGINNTLTNFSNNIEKSFGSITKGFIAIGAIGGAAAGLKSMISGSLQLADSIQKTSDQVGLSTDSIQRWDYALRQNGSSIEEAGKGFRTLNVKIYEAYEGSKGAIETFSRLGVSIRDTNGVLKGNSQVSTEVIYALSEMQNVTERTALAQQLFGKASADLLPLLAQGKDAIKASLEDADKYGQVLSNSTIKALDQAGDAWGTVGRSAQVFGAELTNLISGPMTSFSTKMAEISSGIRKFFKPDEQSEEDKKVESLNRITNQIKELNTQMTNATKSGQDFVASGFSTGKWEKVATSDIASKIKELEQQKKEIEKTLNPNPKSPGGGAAGTKKGVIDEVSSAAVEKALSGSKVFQGFINDNVTLIQMQSFLLSQFDPEKLGVSLENQQENAKFQLSILREIEQSKAEIMGDYRSSEISNVENYYSDLIERARAAGIETVNIEKDKQAAINRINFEYAAQGVANTARNLEIIAKKHKEFTGLYKAAAISQALMDTYASAVASYKSLAGIPVVGPVLGFAASAAAVGAGLFNVGMIASQRLASGGVAPYSGIYRVGEHGPEDVYLHAGAQVMNSIQTRNNNNSSTVTNIYNIRDFTGGLVDSFRKLIRSGEADRLLQDINNHMALA